MKTFSIAGLEIPCIYVQAPLAGYTTFAMRELARQYGAGLTYTEMTSANAINYQNKKTYDMLPHKKESGPVALQLFGSKIDVVTEAVKYVNDHAIFDFLDFNLGCPAKKVLRQKAGSYLLKDLPYLYDMMRKIVEVSSHPVLAKIRIGFEDIETVKIGKVLKEAGVKAIAVHGRTTKEGFVGPVHYDEIAKLKEAVSVPVIANGNISLSNIDEVMGITKADAFMIGREAIGNPKLFEDLINHEEGRQIREKSLEEQIRNLEKHLELQIEEKGEKLACTQMRGISSIYLKGFEGMKPLRNQLVRCSNRKEYLDLLDPYLKKAE
jgi:tRNA-dihydrouridine synthase B